MVLPLWSARREWPQAGRIEREKHRGTLVRFVDCIADVSSPAVRVEVSASAPRVELLLLCVLAP